MEVSREDCWVRNQIDAIEWQVNDAVCLVYHYGVGACVGIFPVFLAALPKSLTTCGWMPKAIKARQRRMSRSSPGNWTQVRVEVEGIKVNPAASPLATGS
jgi:hypothetical protein